MKRLLWWLRSPEYWHGVLIGCVLYLFVYHILVEIMGLRLR